MRLSKLFIILITASGFGLASCSLDEELGSTVTRAQADSVIKVPALLEAAYNGLQLPYQDQSNFWALQEMTADEAVAPTRGGDWDDNGVWRALKLHNWTPDHTYISNTFTNILQLQFLATNVLSFKPSARQAAEARFLRAFAMFTVLDGWGQVPFRNPGDTLLNAPRVMTSTEATTYIIGELTEIIDALDENVPAFTANKNAARALLMKCYLNKGAFANRQAPTFDPADMQKVIELADDITASGRYSLTNYFDNFAFNNDAISKENIFTQRNGPGYSTVRSGNAAFCHWAPTLHYNQDPSGWNGYATISDFYDKFEATDVRRGGDYPGVTDRSGLKVGFLVGQQVNASGTALKDRKGNPLIFTRELKLQETDPNTLEVTGIRVVKYPPDMTNNETKSSNNANNDYVFLRYADVLLMKAEALLRTNRAGDALTIVNTIRTHRKASSWAAVDLDKLIDERGRELYWEGWRRQDLIRFGKFLQPWQLKPNDDPKNLLFPIPTRDLAVNRNLQQNEGY
ncbi:RagB/SusD family nutrient uptake outer membrane protein [Chitinophaga rhizophila]|uniref:RagB/SusD family nutrient uptake outer membrane protein n=1 Tax=Chitinophaga rhizophila TaxID=2866212 RepID=A0ABS7GE45_9BACT|nr:RagB/SusD family nutrient uptake outer membrane protein [Chitinophaga rhizophila]MBW8685928.1 RagB/SusD family nutrient uptake outer membrane protein [Chitinophaga rhizophila]